MTHTTSSRDFELEREKGGNERHEMTHSILLTVNAVGRADHVNHSWAIPHFHHNIIRRREVFGDSRISDLAPDLNFHCQTKMGFKLKEIFQVEINAAGTIATGKQWTPVKASCRSLSFSYTLERTSIIADGITFRVGTILW